MVFPARLRQIMPIVAQCGLVLSGLLLLYAFPPSDGRILLVPMTTGAREMVAPLAVENGARLVTAGPWPGSLLVEGRLDRLSYALLTNGILLLSANAGGCGESQA